MFAGFVTKKTKKFLICIDCQFTVLIYDVANLESEYNPTEADTRVLRVELVKPVKYFKLF